MINEQEIHNDVREYISTLFKMLTYALKGFTFIYKIKVHNMIITTTSNGYSVLISLKL